MPSKQKQRSYVHETELANIGLDLGYGLSKRAWGSNGESLGWAKEVDVVWSEHETLPPVTIQSKVKQKYDKWFTIYIDHVRDFGTYVHLENLGVTLMSLDTFIKYNLKKLDVFDITQVYTTSRTPKWLTEQYIGSLTEADIVVFRRMSRSVSKKHNVVIAPTNRLF